VVGEPFGKWVSEIVEKRNENLAVKNDLMINLDPAVAVCFQASKNISTSKGNGASLLKYVISALPVGPGRQTLGI